MPRLSLALDTADLAEHYEQASADRQFRFGQTLVAELGIKPGHRVLDIGSGTGLLARHVAELVGPTGRVEGLDPRLPNKRACRTPGSGLAQRIT